MLDYKEIGKRVMQEIGVPPIMQSENGCIHCPHPDHELRQRTKSNGSVTVWFQCLACGGAVGSQQKKAPNFYMLPKWDVALENRTTRLREVLADRNRAAIANAEAAAKEEWTRRYTQHVNPKNPKWMALRSKVIQRCGNLCEGCRERPVHHVHHLTYTHLGDELLFELVGVCLPCHAKIHPGHFG